MWPLLACSIAALAIFLHRCLALRASYVIPPRLARALVEGAPSEEIRRLSDGSSSPLAAIAETALVQRHPNQEAAAQATEARARQELLNLQGGLSALEVIITIAPLLGLLGTVSGLVTVFSGLGNSAEETDTKGVAKGIAEALNTTIAGLAIAIPAVVAHGYFQRKIERLASRMEIIFQQAIALAYRPIKTGKG